MKKINLYTILALWVLKFRSTSSLCPPLEQKEGVDLKCKSLIRNTLVNCQSVNRYAGVVAQFRCHKFWVSKGTPRGEVKCSLSGEWEWIHDYQDFECEPECGTPTGLEPLIIFGQDALKNQFPWHATLFRWIENQQKLVCGGNLIHLNGEFLILTAAHCITNLNKTDQAANPEEFKIILGGTSSIYSENEKNSQIFNVKRLEIHPNFTPDLDHDIGVIWLDGNVTLSDSVKPICLERSVYGVNPWDSGRVPGFGITEFNNISRNLIFAELQIRPRRQCLGELKKNSKFIFSSEKFCAGNPPPRNSGEVDADIEANINICFGDSGGGFVQFMPKSKKFEIIGIVSAVFRDNILPCAGFAYFVDPRNYIGWIRGVQMRDENDQDNPNKKIRNIDEESPPKLLIKTTIKTTKRPRINVNRITSKLPHPQINYNISTPFEFDPVHTVSLIRIKNSGFNLWLDTTSGDLAEEGKLKLGGDNTKWHPTYPNIWVANTSDILRGTPTILTPLSFIGEDEKSRKMNENKGSFPASQKWIFKKTPSRTNAFQIQNLAGGLCLQSSPSGELISADCRNNGENLEIWTIENLSFAGRNWNCPWDKDALNLEFMDNDISIYLDKMVRPNEVSWMPQFIGEIWRYLKKVFKYVGPNGRLFAIVHSRGFFSVIDHETNFWAHQAHYKNMIHMGASSWEESSKIYDDTIFSILFVAKLSGGLVQGRGFAEMWYHGLRDIFRYDIFQELGMEAEASRVFREESSRSVYQFSPRRNTHWFRDWWWPLYSNYGGISVMMKYRDLIKLHFPKSEFLHKMGKMNFGEFVLFWSGAAGKDLRPYVEEIFGWTRTNNYEFESANRKYNINF